MGTAIGLAEFKSIAKGIEITDKMTKKSDVKILENRVVCIGKFFVIISGDVAEVESAIDEARSLSEETLINSKVIPSLMDGVADKINARIDRSSIDSIGIVETRNVSNGFYCANYVKKFSNVELLRISATFGFGGKSIVLFTGELSSVKSGIQTAQEKLNDPSDIVESVVIASPSKEFLENFLS